MAHAHPSTREALANEQL